MSDYVKQQALLRDPASYVGDRLLAPRKGVILDVHYPDDPANRTAFENEEFRGYMATATVLVVDPYALLPHVLIPPGNMAHGIDNFEEWYPRGSSQFLNGEEFDLSLSQIDPYDLDGDWCIIQFINGRSENPYVARWWPNPRNIYDTLTTGKAYAPQFGSEGKALRQKGRYFRRVNGVEHVISASGDIWLSTYRAGSTILPGEEKLDGGRFPRLSNDVGGNIKVQVKPTKVLELSWDEQIDGLGVDGTHDESLPQPNPAEPKPAPTDDTQKTYVRIDQDKFEVSVPITLEVRSSDSISLSATNTIDLISNSVRVGSADASEAMILGNKLKDWLSKHTHPTGTGPSGAPVEQTALADILSTKHKIDE